MLQANSVISSAVTLDLIPHCIMRNNSMKTTQRFTNDIIAAIHKEKILGIRAGKKSTHRIIGIWAVVVEGRVFVRSWSLKPRSWHQTFIEDPYGSMFVGEREIPISAVTHAAIG
jgi:hypothetical protein